MKDTRRDGNRSLTVAALFEQYCCNRAAHDSKRLSVPRPESRRRDTAVRQFRFAATPAYSVRGSVSAAVLI
jgi:hypothetical protein